MTTTVTVVSKSGFKSTYSESYAVEKRRREKEKIHTARGSVAIRTYSKMYYRHVRDYLIATRQKAWWCIEELEGRHDFRFEGTQVVEQLVDAFISGFEVGALSETGHYDRTPEEEPVAT